MVHIASSRVENWNAIKTFQGCFKRILAELIVLEQILDF